MERTLTFWKNGFSIDDGPLQDYQDPANEDFLESIKQGVAPVKYLNVKPGEKVQVKVAHKMEEDYVAPKKVLQAFSGKGQRLGSVIPGDGLSASSSSVGPSVPSTAPKLEVDPSQPTTNIQVRLTDGTRLVVKCNHTHTLQDLYNFVRAARPGTSSFFLSTPHPVVALEESSKTVKVAGLLNSVVVQKNK